MARVDPVIVFILAVVAWAVLLAALIGGCGGGPRRCRGADATSIQREQYNPCAEEVR